MRFNPPPNWPAPPRGWEPAPHWQPDPSWPPPPRGWQLWVPESPTVPATAPQLPAAQPAPPLPPRNGRPSSSIQASVIPTPSNATNRAAIAALVFAVLLPPVGIGLGLSARRQVRRTHEGGDGLAKAAVVVGGVLLVLYLIGAIVATVAALA